jgi:hypothetical protein
MAARVSTVLMALIACGVDNDVHFMDHTQAESVAEDVLDNFFTTCMDLSPLKNSTIISKHILS